jgi:hypothetical protein
LRFRTASQLKQMRFIRKASLRPVPNKRHRPRCAPQQHANCGCFAAADIASARRLAFPTARISMNGY